MYVHVRWNLLCTYPSLSWSRNKQHTVCTKALDFNSRPHIKQSQSFIISVQLRSFSAATGFFHSPWTPGIRFFPVNQLLIVLSIPCQKLKQTNKTSRKSWNPGPGVMNFSCENQRKFTFRRGGLVLNGYPPCLINVWCVRIVQFFACHATDAVVLGLSNPEMFLLLCSLTT